MAPRPDVSVERKRQIFEAALTCFSRRGYHRTTMDDIAEESDLSKGTLYWYFESKKALFIALFQEMMAYVGDAWDRIVADDNATATEKLTSSLALIRTEMVEMVQFMGIMMEAWALTRHDQDVEGIIRDLYDPYLEMMHRVIEEGVASGEFHTDKPRALALVVMTLFDGIYVALATGLWQQDWNEIIDEAEQLVLRGLGVDSV